MIKEIAIIGHFGGDNDLLDGQTIKTKILYDELKNHTDWEIRCIDTYYKKKHPIRLLLSVLCVMNRKLDTVVLLSGNGMKWLFPILSGFSKLNRVRIYHCVIGGNLDKYVEKYPKFKIYLNNFAINWVETIVLKNKLEELGINNCDVIPNFKRLNIQDCNENQQNEGTYRFCIFSRVMKEKGIEDAIEAIETINRTTDNKCELDIYGQVDSRYAERFKEVMKKSSDAINYKGVVPYNESAECLRRYYALLFPTYWEGEGFPGTVIDSFSAGLPVIASDWNSNGEIISNYIDGIIYPCEVATNLKEAILYAINNRELITEMRKNCCIKARKYQSDEHIKQIINEMWKENPKL